MKSKALLFGLNYKHCSNGQLKGCINDTKYMAEYIKNEFKIPVEIYTDDTDLFNTSYGGILCNLYNLAIESYKDNLDFVWIHYSGHGSSVKDISGDESDGKDETLVPSDYETTGLLIDDYIHKAFEAFNPKTKILFICDSCHSGTIADIKYSWDSNKCTIENNKCNAKAYIATISGCLDDQTSADAYNLLGNNENIGALTASVLKSFKENPKCKNNLFELVNTVKIHLKLGGFSQYPKLCSTYDLNKDPSIFNILDTIDSPDSNISSDNSNNGLLNDISIDDIINEYVPPETTQPSQPSQPSQYQHYQYLQPSQPSQPTQPQLQQYHQSYNHQAHVVPTIPYHPPSQAQYYFAPIKPQPQNTYDNKPPVNQQVQVPHNNSYNYYVQNAYQEYKPYQNSTYNQHTNQYKREIDRLTEPLYHSPRTVNTPRNVYQAIQQSVHPAMQHISTPRYVVPSQTYIEPSPRYVVPSQTYIEPSPRYTTHQLREQLYNQYNNRYSDLNNQYQPSRYINYANITDNYEQPYKNTPTYMPTYTQNNLTTRYNNEMYC